MINQESRPLDRDGIVRPEWAQANDVADELSDLDGIEIDNAIERPQEGQPRQQGGSV